MMVLPANTRCRGALLQARTRHGEKRDRAEQETADEALREGGFEKRNHEDVL
jgi:hypothetical protein